MGRRRSANNVIPSRVETCRLDVEHDADLYRLPMLGIEFSPKHKLSEHAIIGRFGQRLGHHG